MNFRDYPLAFFLFVLFPLVVLFLVGSLGFREYQAGVKHGLSQCYPYAVPHDQSIKEGD